MTSSRQSRYVSAISGKSSQRRAPPGAGLRDRSRCSQKGVRLPARRPGRSSARAAFMRNCAPKTAESGSSAQEPSSCLGRTDTGYQIEGELGVGLGKAQEDAVVAALDLDLHAGALAQRLGQDQPPGAVDPAPERGVHHHARVAQGVLERLDQDGAVGRDGAGAVELAGDVVQDDVSRRLVERVLGAAARRPAAAPGRSRAAGPARAGPRPIRRPAHPSRAGPATPARHATARPPCGGTPPRDSPGRTAARGGRRARRACAPSRRELRRRRPGPA